MFFHFFEKDFLYLKKLLITSQSHVACGKHVENEQKFINCVHNVKRDTLSHFVFFSSPKKTVISCRRLNTQQTFLRLRLQHKKVTEKKRCSPAMLYNTCPRVHLAFIYHSAHLKLRNNHDQRRSLNAFNISYTKWPFFKTFLTTQQNSNSFKPSSLVNARCVGVKRWR